MECQLQEHNSVSICELILVTIHDNFMNYSSKYCITDVKHEAESYVW